MNNLILGQTKFGEDKPVGKPLVSCIIPNKDCPFFKEALDSVLAQTYENTEIIVVLDNCSTSTKIDVVTIIEEIDKPIKVIEKDDGKGSIPSARNAGLKEAKGLYIAYCSADDVWYPTFLERTVGIGDIVYTNYDRINSHSNYIGETTEIHFEHQEDFNIHLWRRCCVNLSACLVHKKVFDKVGLFDEELIVSEDYLFYLLAAKHFKFTHLQEHLIAYRIHGAQETNKGLNDKFDKVLKDKARKYYAR